MKFSKTILYILSTVLCGNTGVIYAVQNFNRELTPREYDLAISPVTDLNALAKHGLLLNKLAYDTYFGGIAPYLSETIYTVTEPIWSAYWTFTFTQWPHEFGHWARAEQVGSNFIIHGYGFPAPYATHEPNKPLNGQEEALVSIAGFEVNALMMRDAHTRFYRNGYLYSDELIHSFFNQIMFPMYSFLFIPRQASRPDVWTETKGDPSEFVLIIFQNYYNRPKLRSDGSVDPALISLYIEASLVSLVTVLLDPTLYRSATAFAYDRKNRDDIVRPWMLGDNQFRWTYGLHMQASTLGYEIYFSNYIWLRDYFFVPYIRYGRPFRDIGGGVSLPKIVSRETYDIGVSIDLWDQAIYGRGGSINLEATYRWTKQFGLFAQAGWKDDGYQIGRRLNREPIIFGGINFRF